MKALVDSQIKGYTVVNAMDNKWKRGNMMAVTEKKSDFYYELLFPEGKDKALTFSYDDCQTFDRKLVAILNQYGMKGTFHLNTYSMGKDNYIETEEVSSLYKGHEVSAHTVSHPFFNQLSSYEMLRELYDDRRLLEQYSGNLVRGMSYPFGEYNQEMIQIAKTAGLVYSRTVNATMNFNIPADFMEWHPTCHHNQVDEQMIEDFLNPPSYRNLSLFYIWGHSFEFDRENNWEKLESICQKLQGRDDIWYATNIEIADYVNAARMLVVSVDGSIFYNPSGMEIWIRLGSRMINIPAGATVHCN